MAPGCGCAGAGTGARPRRTGHQPGHGPAGQPARCRAQAATGHRRVGQWRRAGGRFEHPRALQGRRGCAGPVRRPRCRLRQSQGLRLRAAEPARVGTGGRACAGARGARCQAGPSRRGGSGAPGRATSGGVRAAAVVTSDRPAGCDRSARQRVPGLAPGQLQRCPAGRSGAGRCCRDFGQAPG